MPFVLSLFLGFVVSTLNRNSQSRALLKAVRNVGAGLSRDEPLWSKTAAATIGFPTMLTTKFETKDQEIGQVDIDEADEEAYDKEPSGISSPDT